VAEALREQIARAGAGDGRLPSEAALAGEFGVARDTVRRALDVLVEEGMIKTTHGRGHFVVEPGTDVGLPRYEVVARALRQQISDGGLRPATSCRRNPPFRRTSMSGARPPVVPCGSSKMRD